MKSLSSLLMLFIIVVMVAAGPAPATPTESSLQRKGKVTPPILTESQIQLLETL